MSELKDEQDLDLLLRRHLGNELDGQLGRAASGFREHLRRQQQQAPVSSSDGPVRGDRARRGGPWMIGVIGTTMAAAVAALFVLPGVLSPTGPIAGSGGVGTGRVEPLPAVRVDHTVRSQLYDGGTYMTPDGTPVRRLRRLNLHQMRWYDERSGESSEEVVPSEDVMIYELKTY